LVVVFSKNKVVMIDFLFFLYVSNVAISWCVRTLVVGIYYVWGLEIHKGYEAWTQDGYNTSMTSWQIHKMEDTRTRWYDSMYVPIYI